VARKSAEQGAFDDARSFLAARLETAGKTPGAQATAAAQYLLEGARIADSYIAYDKGHATYRAYALLALGKKLASTDLQLFAAKNNVPVSAVQAQALQTASRKPDDYLAQRAQVYTAENNKAQATLQPAQYDQYTRARMLRQQGKGEQAIPHLKEVVRQNPDFYLGWYNLALAYDDRDDFANGKAAYEKAIELEKKSALRDASLYNSYGYFLFKNKKFREAASSLKTAVMIAPDHPKAKTTLTAVQAQIGTP
jgi:Flp pilus assembly protein TadD